MLKSLVQKRYLQLVKIVQQDLDYTGVKLMIDLHTHSTASDGTDSPEELVKKAHKEGISALALTDHDTLAGLDEAEEAARGLLPVFIRGCEVSTKTPSGSMHILGLWLPRQCEEVENFLVDARERRDKRNRNMVEKFEKLGIKIVIDELYALGKGSLGRPHFAQLLLEKGYVENREQAFSEYLGENGKAYVPKNSPTPEEVIPLLTRNGATVIWAHPLLKDRSTEWVMETAQKLGPYGLAGLEAWHTAQGMDKTRTLMNVASQTGMALAGGSDYHGLAKPGFRLGHAGAHILPDYIYDNLKNYRLQKGLAI